ncbi:hypothetical protein GH714_025129 [Hevea brasiliensis]|uniref:Glycine--tRNA ligase n=1 Tax=Hevea brasiliensis TaxID=3981 RepID=A0A6A6MGH4_HEVBR|nr:hypothetical protein GH714_025129 [Hevea brasiliensis]
MEALKVLKSENASIERRLQIAVLSNSSNENGNAFANKDAFRQAVINTLERRLFYTPSFKIYGCVTGLFDYGPPGCAVKSNVLAFWRQVSFLIDTCALRQHKAFLSTLRTFTTIMAISPRQGLLRVREFTLAEIEHFVDPDNKSRPKFSEVANLEFLMFPREVQVSGQSARRIPLGEAFSMGIVNNEMLGYFIGRVYLFLICLGIDKEQLHFIQHLANEMAHYAADCWDAEIECFYGQIECVGIADRSAYDLRAHMDLVIHPMKKELGLTFKGNQKVVIEALEAMDEREAMEMKAVLESQGEVWYRVCRLDKDVIIKKNRWLVIFKERERTSKGLYTISD